MGDVLKWQESSFERENPTVFSEDPAQATSTSHCVESRVPEEQPCVLLTGLQMVRNSLLSAAPPTEPPPTSARGCDLQPVYQPAQRCRLSCLRWGPHLLPVLRRPEQPCGVGARVQFHLCLPQAAMGNQRTRGGWPGNGRRDQWGAGLEPAGENGLTASSCPCLCPLLT